MKLFVSYCQYEVTAVPGAPGLEIYTLGDDLLHLNGPSRLTGFCGTHTGWIDARARVHSEPPARAEVGWDAISEATLWCPSGRLSVVGLMGGLTETLTDIAVPRGLIRVRLHARNRLREGLRTDHDPPEQHEIHVWAVADETPWRTLVADPQAREWEQKPAKAAEWAMLSLVRRRSGRPALLAALPPDPYEDSTGLARVAVVRHRAGPVELPVGVLPVGDLDIRLERIDDTTLTWSWATAADPIFPKPLTTLPDEEPSTVRLTSGPDGFTLRHEGVLGRHASAVGLIWDHLLDAPGPLPWSEPLRAQAAKAAARAERSRRLADERDAAQWGGRPPSDRMRKLPGKARSLALVDRAVLDALETLPGARCREVACWAARRAMRVAGLEGIGWIAEILTAAEAGQPLPESLGVAGFNRLLSDPDVPHTTVPMHLPGHGVSEILQQAAAFPALTALANDDPLGAAIDAAYNAALAHGDDRDRFLADLFGRVGLR
ncbi:hypothetical protein [Actinoplanes friuliensis]|uniref:Uncharacterized protein n=1 Tax=Actinoplanes friuliensis DSM 7358 TaxID=1246995 RepID=U5W7W4_9ACTN|nr:hypothetical protein [Actinoplanes friuliensis]AGZ45092.1 hypothetical protein AFR_34170 [Actinoplanes friuliensis DSM 7358]